LSLIVTESDDTSGSPADDRISSNDRGQLPGRVASVDVLRGLTILLMIFVNDLGPKAPSWMHHIQPSDADGMTLADIVFPAFLFIVGVSIPLALERGPLSRGRRLAQLAHILVRTLALLFMGLIQLNADRDGVRLGSQWGMLAFIALICAWCVVPREPGLKRGILITLKIAGALGLIALVAIYRSKATATDLPFLGHFDDWVWFRTEWWGILGLIGWAYLTAPIVWLVLGRRREWLMGAAAILMLLHLAMRRGGLFARLEGKPWLGWSLPIFEAMKSALGALDQYVSLADALGSLAAISVAGCLLGSILRRVSDVATHRDRLSWAFTFTLGLLIAGFVCDNFEGINKIAATPTWCLWSAALATAVWMVLYLILDVWGFRGWAILVRPAGANPLVAYFLHPITVELIGVLGLGDHLLAYQSSANPYLVVAGSLAMAMFICVATGILSRLGLAVRL
jgi:heparan-alpha-glucosaminide N-acetyltransferase